MITLKNKLIKEGLKRFYEYTDLPQNVSPDCVSITIYDNNRFALESAYEIVKYSENLISLKLESFIITLTGDKLQISALNPNYIVIKGEIIKIEYMNF